MRISLPLSVLYNAVVAVGKNSILADDEEVTIDLSSGENWISLDIVTKNGTVSVALENTSTGLKRYFPDC
jgi:hypothetical protein